MDQITELIKQIALEFPNITKVILFGSRARGDNNEKSDYDIAVFHADSKTQALFRDRTDRLPTLCKIDIVYISESHKGTELYKSILKDGVVIMSKFTYKLENFKKAVDRLDEAINDANEYKIETLKDAVIQRFEFTTELAWKTAREYLSELGETDIDSPKPVMRTAFRAGLVTDEQGWIQILDDRNVTSHIYDDKDAEAVYKRIVENHINLFKALLENTTKLAAFPQPKGAGKQS